MAGSHTFLLFQILFLLCVLFLILSILLSWVFWGEKASMPRMPSWDDIYSPQKYDWPSCFFVDLIKNPSFTDTQGFVQLPVWFSTWILLPPMFPDGLAALCLGTNCGWSYPAVLCHTYHIICLTRYCLFSGYQYEGLVTQTSVWSPTCPYNVV